MSDVEPADLAPTEKSGDAPEWWDVYLQCVTDNLPVTEAKAFWSKEVIEEAKLHRVQTIKTFFVKMIHLLQDSCSAQGAHHQEISMAMGILSVIIKQLAEDPAFEEGFFWEYSFSQDKRASCGSALLDAVIALLALPGFTLPENVRSLSAVSASMTVQPPETTEGMILRQAELVNLLLTCVVTPPKRNVSHSLWAIYLCQNPVLFEYLTRIVFAYHVPNASRRILWRRYKPQISDTLAASCCHLWTLLMKDSDAVTPLSGGNEGMVSRLNSLDGDVMHSMYNSAVKNLVTSLSNFAQKEVDFTTEYTTIIWILLRFSKHLHAGFGEKPLLGHTAFVCMVDQLLRLPKFTGASGSPMQSNNVEDEQVKPADEEDLVSETTATANSPRLSELNDSRAVFAAVTVLAMSTRKVRHRFGLTPLRPALLCFP
eukprot:Blabericola_migrator_1__348@NODE_1089_length_5477_cov_158_481146_g628_i2_p2_GENE_NODE_1089_length_5477_cov_158_481146_g628_i2NODE_1089_length_5477_cov_158_481146_g628_i2_p2_ORF_typecomplete_len440_score57_92Hid1/PF12722_7/2_3e13_NODE_1089_length_5477_cov_158_481146_g628_i2411321